MKEVTSKTVKAMRQQSGMNQAAFWGRFGFTQSGGSRYESGRAIPKPVQKLLVIAGKDREAERELKRVRGA